MGRADVDAVVEQYWEAIQSISADVWSGFEPSTCDAEDVAQEVCLAILEGRRVIDGAHASTGIRQAAINAIKHLTRDAHMITASSDPAIEDLFYSSIGPEEAAYLD